MNLPDLLLTAPVPILESVARQLRWRCSLNLWTALTSVRGSADASPEHQLLLAELRQSAAATLLQRLAWSHTSGHLLCGQSLRQRATYLHYYLKLPTVAWLRAAACGLSALWARARVCCGPIAPRGPTAAQCPKSLMGPRVGQKCIKCIKSKCIKSEFMLLYCPKVP
jgi:hypothetical protein